MSKEVLKSLSLNASAEVYEATLKTNLFTVQRVSVIEASIGFFGFVGKYRHFLGKKKKKKTFFCKGEKKVPIRTFFNHPAATPETEVFFSMA